MVVTAGVLCQNQLERWTLGAQISALNAMMQSLSRPINQWLNEEYEAGIRLTVSGRLCGLADEADKTMVGFAMA